MLKLTIVEMIYPSHEIDREKDWAEMATEYKKTWKSNRSQLKITRHIHKGLSETKAIRGWEQNHYRATHFIAYSGYIS